MSHSFLGFRRSVLVGVALVTTSLGACTMTISRCTLDENGSSTPVLLVDKDGQTIMHRVGDDGLSRQILFDEAATLAWVKAKYGADAVSGTFTSCDPSGRPVSYAAPTADTGERRSTNGSYMSR